MSRAHMGIRGGEKWGTFSEIRHRARSACAQVRRMDMTGDARQILRVCIQSRQCSMGRQLRLWASPGLYLRTPPMIGPACDMISRRERRDRGSAGALWVWFGALSGRSLRLGC